MAENEYIGVVKKCPACGGVIESLTSHCPFCNLELSDVSTNATTLLFRNSLVDMRYRREKNSTKFGLKNGKVVMEEVEWEENDTNRKELVENFTIPNAIADFMEFFIYAIVMIDPDPQIDYDKKWNEIWIEKCKQVYEKARIAMAGEPALLDYMKQLAQETGFNL